MFLTCVFTKDFRCFKKGSLITLRPGVNLLVGDQGCGKSTFLTALNEFALRKSPGRHKYDIPMDAEGALEVLWEGPPGRFGHFDFEKSNPRTMAALGMDPRIDTSMQVCSMFSSHGESTKHILAMCSAPVESNVLALDEPDMALSPRSLYKFLADLKQNVGKDSQVIMSVHNPAMIQEYPEVLSLEHERWMPSLEFLDLHKTTSAPVYDRKKPRLVKITSQGGKEARKGKKP